MTANLGQPVEVANIDKELRKLWEADEAATNASLMNFAVYSEDSSQLDANSDAISELTREHACRALLVGMERAGDELSIEAWITAHCHLAHGRKTVCCEQISFLLRGKAVGRLRNTVFAHLASDLPLVFWWQGELSDIFEERLYRLMDRLIVDSSEWTDVAGGFQKLAEAVQDSRCRMAVQDLAWTRNYHFRLAIAGLFDDAAAERMLPKISQVVVEGRSSDWTCHWMLVAWVATQAEWTMEKNQEAGFRFLRKDGEPVEIVLKGNEGGAALARVLITDGETELEVLGEEGRAFLDLSLRAPGHHLTQMAPADPQRRVELVAEQLSRGGKNSLFRKTWPLLFEMLETSSREIGCKQ